MIRAELVRRLVLNSICDDFENVDQRILRDVAEAGAKRGLIVERWEVVQALAGLIDAMAWPRRISCPGHDAGHGRWPIHSGHPHQLAT